MDNFENRNRAVSIAQYREKVAEKITKDKDQQKKSSEEMNSKINDLIFEKSAEKVLDEENKAKTRNLEKLENNRQRKHM